MVVVNFVIVFIGLMVVFRNFSDVINVYFERKSTNKLFYGSVVVIICFQLLFFSFSVPIGFVFLIISVLLSYQFERIVSYFLEKRFKDNFCHLLSEIILNMKVGNSFWTSYETVMMQTDAFMQHKLGNVMTLLKFHQGGEQLNLNGFPQKVVLNLTRILKSKSNTLKQLEDYRNKLSVESEFRRKSGHASSQVNFQMLIMTGMYFALSVFGIRYHSFERTVFWMMYSAPVFLMGVVLVEFIKRSFKWKV